MFGLTEWRQTKFYQEVKLGESLRESLRENLKESLNNPRMLNMGLSVEQIAQALDLEVEVVRKAIEKQSGGES
jgi:predicted transposase YdaD